MADQELFDGEVRTTIADDENIAFRKADPTTPGSRVISWANFKTLLRGAFVDLVNNQVIDGIKQFIKSPTVPDPTTDLQAVNLRTLNNKTGDPNYTDYIPQDPVPVFKRGRFFFDDVNDCFCAYANGNTFPAIRVGRSVYARVSNNTLSTLTRGSVVKAVGIAVITPSVELAKADSIEDIETVIGVVAEDIAAGQLGYVAVFEAVTGLDTSALTVNKPIYLSDEVAGGITSTPPAAPNYRYPIGLASAIDPVNGAIGVRISGVTINDTETNFQGAINGIVPQTPQIDYDASSGDIIATVSNEAFPTKDLPVIIDGKRYLLDTTTAPATIIIPPGLSSTQTQESILYIKLNAGVPELAVTTATTVSEPFAILAVQTVFDATRTNTDGKPLSYRRYNNAMDSLAEGVTGAYGHINVISNWIRLRGGAGWTSGQDGTPTVDDLNIKLALSAGVGGQLHRANLPSFDGNSYLIYNDNSNNITYQPSTNLTDITETSDGQTLLNNNVYYPIKIYYLLNSNGVGNDVIATRPSGFYNSAEGARTDGLGYGTIMNDPVTELNTYAVYTMVIGRTGGAGATISLIELQDNRTRTLGGGGKGTGAGVGVGTDDKVRITASDTNNDYLDPKISVSDKLLKSIDNQGSNEAIFIDIKNPYKVLVNYTELDSYTGDETLVYIDNYVYGGEWIRDDTATIRSDNKGIVRAGAGGRVWRRLFAQNRLNVNWWIENEAIDASLVVSAYIQNAISYSLFAGIKNVDFNGAYLVDAMDWSTPGLGGYVYNGNGSFIHLNYNDNQYAVKIGTGGGDEGTELHGFTFVGTEAADPTYTAGKHRLIEIDGHRYPNIHNCHFTRFTSQAIYVKSLSGSLYYKGLYATNNTFTEQVYDSSTTDQAAIYFAVGAEYSSISFNSFDTIVQAVKIIDGANIDIAFNQVGDLRGELQSGGIDLTRAAFFVGTSGSPVNNGKIKFIGNRVNHVDTAQIPIVVIGTNTVNEDNTVQIIGNECLANGYFPSIYLKDFNNPIINANHFRALNIAQATHFITLDNVDNAIVTSNNCVDGRWVVGLTNNSNDLIYANNNVESTLLTFGDVEVVSGSIRDNSKIEASTPYEFQFDNYLSKTDTADQSVESNVDMIKQLVLRTVGVNNGLAFGDKDTSIYELVDDLLTIRVGGVNIAFILSSAIQSGIVGGWQLKNVTPTATLPSIYPARDDERTGIGHAGTNILSLIADFKEGMRVTGANVEIFHDLLVNSTIETTTAIIENAISVDPDNPLSNKSIVWTSDGTGSGEDGDYMIKITNSLGETHIQSLLNKIELQLPSFIDVVSSDICQIYYSSMIEFANWENYYFSAGLSVGADYKRYIEVDTSSPGDYTLNVNMYGSNNALISQATTTIRVRNSVQQPASTVNYWCVGDSLTADLTYPNEMHRRLTGVGGTPAGDAYGNIVQHIEGNSGKEWNWYVNDEASPFVYSGVLDFEQYRIDNALAVPQVLYILLTWNGMSAYRTQAQWDVWDNDVYTFIDALRAAFPNVDVKLMSPQFPSQNGGLGESYGAILEGYSNQFIGNRNAYKQAQIYERISNEASYSSWVEHINTALVFDSKYNMPAALKNVNTRNSTHQESIGTNGVHPSTEGYYQIADAAYRNFIANYCQ
jgi:hypothetical protein